MLTVSTKKDNFPNPYFSSILNFLYTFNGTYLFIRFGACPIILVSNVQTVVSKNLKKTKQFCVMTKVFSIKKIILKYRIQEVLYLIEWQTGSWLRLWLAAGQKFHVHLQLSCGLRAVAKISNTLYRYCIFIFMHVLRKKYFLLDPC